MKSQHEARLSSMLSYFEQNKLEDLKRVNQYLQLHAKVSLENNTSPFESALHFSHCDKQSVECWLSVHKKYIPQFHQYLLNKYRLLGKSKICEWDVMPPPPEPHHTNVKNFTEEEMVNFVARCFSTVDPDWGKHVSAVYKLGLIDFHSPQNYSTRKSHPKYLNVYIQSQNDVLSIVRLAHELGHMIHCYYLEEKSFHFIYAELVSLFCEKLVALELKKQIPEQGKIISWYEFSTPDLVIAPISFEVERDLFKHFGNKEITLDEIEDLEGGYIKKWFGIEELGQRPTFWQRGFHVGQPLFYNYVNAICYLISLNLEKNQIQAGIKDSSLLDLRSFMMKYFSQNLHHEKTWLNFYQPLKIG